MESIKIAIELKEKYVFNSSSDFTSYFMSLTSALRSASEKKLYDDFLQIFPKYKAIIQAYPNKEPPTGFHNNAIFFQFNMTALLYSYFTYKTILIADLRLAIEELSFWTSKVDDKSSFEEPNKKLVELVESVIAKESIYYTIEFNMPYHIPLEDGIYELSFNDKIVGVETHLLKSDDLVSFNKDRFFSKIKLTIQGFTNCDAYWMGPSIKNLNSESSTLLMQILEIMNNFIMRIKLFDNNVKIHMITADDIGRITTEQFYSNGNQYHMSMALQLSGLSMVDVLSAQKVEGDVEDFRKNIFDSELLLYEELFSIALIDYSNENYLSAFMILHSATEAMIEWYLKSYCYITNKIEFYDNLMSGTSMYEDCQIYLEKQHDEANYEYPIKTNIPSLMTQVKRVLMEAGIVNTEIRKISKLINKIKQDSLRNDLIHGRKRNVLRGEISSSLQYFKELEHELEKIHISLSASA